MPPAGAGLINGLRRARPSSRRRRYYAGHFWTFLDLLERFRHYCHTHAFTKLQIGACGGFGHCGQFTHVYQESDTFREKSRIPWII